MKTKLNSITRLIAIFVALCGSIQLFGMRTQFDEKHLDDIALTQGYGYKYANLCELKKISSALNQKKLLYAIAVPEFVGIPSSNIQTFLKTKANLDLAIKWKNIINRYFPSKQPTIVTTKQFPAGFLDACAQLETEIKNAFDTIARNVSNNFSFDASFNNSGHVILLIDKLLATIKQHDQHLMVRSTGREDTNKLANAGGNESVSNVTATTKEILYAMRDVVASYFGKKSLTQRLGAGDTSLFDPIPFTPVLIQHMIGEKHPEQLPKCGVMFTEETEGGISQREIKNEDGSTKTTGITVIQSAYGHNEGVVNSLIPVDTFYVDANHTIYPVIRQKTYRMTPSAGRKLELKENTGAIVRQPALNRKALIALKTLATTLEDYYHAPMDVEFVIDETNTTIYLVQARPIVHNPNIPTPSYIINPDAIPHDSKLNGSGIGVAGGALRMVKNANEIIAAATIGDALDIYQNTGIDTQKVQCIVVGKMAPATSHEATTFRGEVKPVLYIPQWQAIEKWLAEPTVAIIVSPQQGLLVKWQGKEKSIDELLRSTSKIAVKGWNNYPIPAFISLSNDFKPLQQLDDDGIIDILPNSLKASAEKFFENIAKVTMPDIKTLFNNIKAGAKEEDALIALATLLYKIRNTISKSMAGIDITPEQRSRIQRLEQYALSFAQAIKQNIDYTPANPDYMKRLLPIRFMESLLMQQPRTDEIVDGYSVATIVGKELLVAQKIEKELEAKKMTLDEISKLYLRIKDVAMVPELEKDWVDFVADFSKNADKKIQEAFYRMIVGLGTLEIIPIWLNTAFAQAYQPQPGTAIITHDIAQKLIDDYTSQREFLKILFEKKKTINALNIEAFGDPKKFDTQWEAFNATLISYFLNQKDFIKHFNNANQIGQLAALEIMTHFVNTFDLAIKALKGSSHYKSDQALHTQWITRFQIMLVQYAAIFEQWITLVPEGAIEYNKKSPLSHYINFINNVLSKKNISSQDFNPTPHFNVAAFTIGSAVVLEGGHPPLQSPETLEDIFTMTHQCLLTAINVLATEAGIGDIELPPLLEEIIHSIEELTITEAEENITSKTSLVGVTFSGSSITELYNLPLRSHSMQLEIRYTKNTPTATLLLHFFGSNEYLRWDKLACLAKALNVTNALEADVVETNISHNGLVLTLLVNQTSNTPSLWTTIQNIAQYSFDQKEEYLEEYLDQLNTAKEAIIAKNPHAQLLFLSILVATGYEDTYQDAFDAAQKAMHSSSPRIQGQCIDVFASLANEQYEVDKIIDIITTTQFADDDEVQMGLFDVWETLIDQDFGITEALQYTQKHLQSTSPNIQHMLLHLLTDLIKKHTGIPEALTMINKTLKSTHHEVQHALLELLAICITNNITPDTTQQAWKAIELTKQSSDTVVQQYLVGLLCSLTYKEIDHSNENHKDYVIKISQKMNEITRLDLIKDKQETDQLKEAIGFLQGYTYINIPQEILDNFTKYIAEH